MLRLDLTRADTEPLVFQERLELPAGSGSVDVVAVGPVQFEGGIERGARGYHLEGALTGSARLRCVRCLTEFPFEYAEHVDVKLLPASGAPREDEIRLGRDDLETRFFVEPSLDLVELAAEQFALTVPMKPLCTADCRGICPRCGATLNQGPCACPKNEPDVRFAPLLDWRAHE
ncbi:MAG: YceD family protein [Thermoanaerobaculales bacterium]